MVEKDVVTIVNLGADLKARWRPTDEVTAAAAAVLAEAGDRATPVYTAHLLINKDYGIWTADVEIFHLAGVYRTRDELFANLAVKARRYHERTGKKVVGGYAIHFRPGEWAVFEDIGSQFPEPEYRTKKEHA